MTNGKQDDLDRALDAALAKYAAAEPRAGLEERVLANLRVARSRSPNRAWWRWGGLAAAAAIVIVAVTLVRRAERTSPPVVVIHQPSRSGARKQPATQVSKDEGRRVHPHTARTMPGTQPGRGRSGIAVAGNPKLEQFPAPLPLSEQEKLLRVYVATYPEEAVLVARARTEELRRERLEEMDGFPAGDRVMDSEEPNGGGTDR